MEKKEEKSAKQVLAERFNTTDELLEETAHCRVSSCLLAMETYADMGKSKTVELVEDIINQQLQLLTNSGARNKQGENIQFAKIALLNGLLNHLKSI